MKKLSQFVLPLFLFVAVAAGVSSCKTARLQDGGAYAPTNEVGEVIYNDLGLALADASYKFAYETALTVFRYERDNRVAIFTVAPGVKRELDKLRPTVVDIDQRWALARKTYRLSPTPEGLTTLQTILAEIQRLLPVIQGQISPVYSSLTKKTVNP